MALMFQSSHLTGKTGQKIVQALLDVLTVQVVILYL